MSITYFPKINSAAATGLISRMLDKQPEELSKLAAEDHPQKYYYETASHFVEREELRNLRSNLMALAKECGFPARKQNSLRDFDQRASKILGQQLDLIPSEAAAPEVWSFLTLVLLPDLAAWRFPNTAQKLSYARWIGGDRNTFARLWWRDATLGYELASFLGEDEAVGIMERPRISGNPAVARSIVRSFMAVAKENEDLPRSDLLRHCMVKVRGSFTLVDFDAFEEEELNEIMAEIFAEGTREFAEKIANNR